MRTTLFSRLSRRLTATLLSLVLGGPLLACSSAPQVLPTSAAWTESRTGSSAGGGSDGAVASEAAPARLGYAADAAAPAAGAPMRTTTPTTMRKEEVSPAERPGLGTEWGETRYSPVRDAAFERADSSPMFLASLHYNDARGVEAMRDRIVRTRADEPVLHYFRGNPARLWGGVSISIVDESGRSLPAYHLGERVLVMGSAGQRYALKVENHTGQRFELVASIDGLDVVDGRSADLEKRGYVVSPHSTLHIDGFRRSMSEVAAFRFGSVKDSYAAQTSEYGAKNVGVIGVALFAERGARVDDSYGRWQNGLDDEARRREQADPFPGRFAAPPPQPLSPNN